MSTRSNEYRNTVNIYFFNVNLQTMSNKYFVCVFSLWFSLKYYIANVFVEIFGISLIFMLTGMFFCCCCSKYQSTEKDVNYIVNYFNYWVVLLTSVTTEITVIFVKFHYAHTNQHRPSPKRT